MKFRLLVLVAFFTIPTSLFAQKNTYVGYKYTGVNYDQKLPNGVRDLGGNLLDDDNYGVSLMKKGKTEMLWLARITGRNTKGIPKWKVKAVLVLPALKKNQEILRGFTYPCTVDQKEDLNLIVLAEYSPEDKTYEAIKAWRADTKANKFETVPAEDVACQPVD